MSKKGYINDKGEFIRTDGGSSSGSGSSSDEFTNISEYIIGFSFLIFLILSFVIIKEEHGFLNIAGKIVFIGVIIFIIVSILIGIYEFLASRGWVSRCCMLLFGGGTAIFLIINTNINIIAGIVICYIALLLGSGIGEKLEELG